jgi:hypothetical protein
MGNNLLWSLSDTNAAMGHGLCSRINLKNRTLAYAQITKLMEIGLMLLRCHLGIVSHGNLTYTIGVVPYAMDMIINIIVWLIIAGFIYWAVKLIIGLLPIDDWFKQIINVLILILVAAIVLFKVLIPVLMTVAHMGSGGFNFNLH